MGGLETSEGIDIHMLKSDIWMSIRRIKHELITKLIL